MLKLAIIVALLTIVVLGDIIVDLLGELIWYIGLRTSKLNFNKRKHSAKRRNFYV